MERKKHFYFNEFWKCQIHKLRLSDHSWKHQLSILVKYIPFQPHSLSLKPPELFLHTSSNGLSSEALLEAVGKQSCFHCTFPTTNWAMGQIVTQLQLFGSYKSLSSHPGNFTLCCFLVLEFCHTNICGMSVNRILNWGF